MEQGFDVRRSAKFGLLTLVAVGGSMIFGQAAGAVLPSVSMSKGAVLLTLSTGCSWLVFGGLLWGITKKPVLSLAEACLVTMAYGEAVLVSGAVLDWLFIKPNLSHLSAAPINAAIILIADCFMATIFACRLKRIGVSPKISLGLWILGLNGSWAIFLFLLIKLLYGGG